MQIQLWFNAAIRKTRTNIALVVISSVLLVSCGKPNISESCAMNGYGRGSCSFTNTGSSEGAMCGKVNVRRGFDSKNSYSDTFCSGSVSPNSTNQVEFSVPDVSNMCSVGTLDWNSVCSFSFNEELSDTSTSWWGYLKIVILLIITAGLFWLGLPESKRIISRSFRKCPFCAEHIKNEAITCKHCGKGLPSLAEEYVQKTVNPISVDTNTPLVNLVVVQPWWKHPSLGRRIILASLLIELASLLMENYSMYFLWPIYSTWHTSLEDMHNQFFGGNGWHISLEGMHNSLTLLISSLMILICWLYPLISIVKNSTLKIKLSIVGPTASLLWIMYHILSSNIQGRLWVELLALTTLIIGLTLYKPISKD